MRTLRMGIAGLLLLLAFRLSAQTCGVLFPGIAQTSGGTINIATDVSSIAQGGVDQWSGGCASYGQTFPSFVVNGGSGIPFSLTFVQGSGPLEGGIPVCGDTSIVTDHGAILGGTIVVYQSTYYGATCNVDEAVAHELGHALGLDDSPSNLPCTSDIMSVGTDVSRSVSAADCAAADGAWQTPTEVPHGGGGCGGSVTTVPGRTRSLRCSCAECPDDPCCGGSPILIDMAGDGIELTGANLPVFFDLDARGEPELIGWTDPEGNDAFLALDRDRNGRIDDGRELFGNYTPMPDGTRAPNGYVALAVFDRPQFGGNGDGRITSADAVYSRLLLWKDLNHNGISEPAELCNLDDAGIVGIDLSYTESRRKDRWGNELRFWSRVWIHGEGRGTRVVRSSDVFFVRIR